MQRFSSRYPVWFCDIWGVVHDGIRPLAKSVDTLSRHRANSGIVILVTNAPRTRIGIEQQLRDIGVAPDAHDRVVTSGDVTRELVIRHGGGKVYHLGPGRDHSILAGLDVTVTGLDEAHAVLCTGLVDDMNDRLEDYASLLTDMKRRGLAMICANPDKIVRKGSRILQCAGALAELYAGQGGSVLMAGKPFSPIYDRAMAEATSLRAAEIRREDVLAIGDGPETDIRGAAGYGLDAVLVAEGVTDASVGLSAVETSVKAAVPNARIVATVGDLSWM